ncbi:MAG TPA: HNH endonuclease [Saprospiraceae bacterium]|nr:HNH endonuclease [Saprospiraceae bacterium]
MNIKLLFLIISIFIYSNGFCQETYKSGNTEYYYNSTYKTTGKPKVKRNQSARNKFLKSMGLNSVPDGYEVDHIKPLSEGGEDEAYNMQLLTKEQHRKKTARERSANSNSTYQSYKYNSTSTFNTNYEVSSTCGAPKKNGGYCTRKVKGGGYCHQHR